MSKRAARMEAADRKRELRELEAALARSKKLGYTEADLNPKALARLEELRRAVRPSGSAPGAYTRPAA